MSKYLDEELTPNWKKWQQAGFPKIPDIRKGVVNIPPISDWKTNNWLKSHGKKDNKK